MQPTPPKKTEALDPELTEFRASAFFNVDVFMKKLLWTVPACEAEQAQTKRV